MKEDVNQKKLEDQGLKSLVYYGELEDKRRFTACLVTDANGHVLAKGVSCCSLNDQFIKSVGRAKAKGRAISALEHEDSRGEFSYYLPTDLTDFERHLATSCAGKEVNTR